MAKTVQEIENLKRDWLFAICLSRSTILKNLNKSLNFLMQTNNSRRRELFILSYTFYKFYKFFLLIIVKLFCFIK